MHQAVNHTQQCCSRHASVCTEACSIGRLATGANKQYTLRHPHIGPNAYVRSDADCAFASHVQLITASASIAPQDEYSYTSTVWMASCKALAGGCLARRLAPLRAIVMMQTMM
jgi:hypothetical protein